MPGPDNPFLLKHLRFCLVLWLLACQVALSAQTLASRPILLAHGFCGSALDFQPLTGPLYQQLPSDLYPSSTVYYVFYDSIKNTTTFLLLAGGLLVPVDQSSIPLRHASLASCSTTPTMVEARIPTTSPKSPF